MEGDGRSTIDLCLFTAGLVDKLIKCGIDDDANHDSDHLPIATSLDLTVTQLQQEKKRNWKAIDETIFTKAIKRSINSLRRPRTKAALDRYVQEIVKTITTAIDKGVPMKTCSPKTRPGWNEECAEVLAETKQHTEQSWREYLTSRNKKGKIIRKTLQKTHREAVEKAAESPESLRRIVKWARNRQNQTPNVTPEIINPSTSQTATTREEKTELFWRTFFPAPPEANLKDIENATYEEQLILPPISVPEVEEATQKAAPLKAPGPDGITNKALQLAKPWISPHLVRTFNQSLQLGYCPQHFRKSTTVVLRKPGKGNYTTPKAYRPIALLNTVGKVMDAIITERLNYMAETHQLLPEKHMGGRRQRSTEHAMHLIIDKIYEAWNRGQGEVASLLLLDVSGAFGNASHRRLLHKLRKRRVDEKIIRWTTSFLGNRQTQIHADGYQSEPYTLTTGIPQGSPLSPILYPFYNADLPERCSQDQETLATGFIDDGRHNRRNLPQTPRALEEAESWATTQASVFAPEKFQLVHFTRAKSRINITTPLLSKWCEIKPELTCKYLGLTMDTALRWKQHIDETERKVSKTITAISSPGNSTWGVRTKEMRTIYQGVAIPQMIATSSPALEVEMYLLPVEQRIWEHNIDAINRLGLIGQEEGESVWNRRRRKKEKKTRPRQTIERELRNRQGDNTRQREPIAPFVTPPWWQGPHVFIAETAETARKEHQKSIDRETEAMHVYTDGSGINGQIGAAAVCTTTNQTRNSYMGPTTTLTVYGGGLQGVILALEIAEEDKKKGNNRSKVMIYTDNQAAIR
ncbi:reverse transcriptase-like protein [Colletotrichum incanum]|nr:reverse transcriptase-like protein [Colletotrichum incanum]